MYLYMKYNYYLEGLLSEGLRQNVPVLFGAVIVVVQLQLAQAAGHRKAARNRMCHAKGASVWAAVRDQIDYLKRASRHNVWGIKVRQKPQGSPPTISYANCNSVGQGNKNNSIFCGVT